MKRLLKISIVLFCGFVVGVLFVGIPTPVKARVGGGAALGLEACEADSTLYSIDSNGDGLFDLSDPIFMLQWLFAGGQPPQVCLAAQEPADLSPILGELQGIRLALAPEWQYKHMGPVASSQDVTFGGPGFLHGVWAKGTPAIRMGPLGSAQPVLDMQSDGATKFYELNIRFDLLNIALDPGDEVTLLYRP